MEGLHSAIVDEPVVSIVLMVWHLRVARLDTDAVVGLVILVAITCLVDTVPAANAVCQPTLARARGNVAGVEGVAFPLDPVFVVVQI